MLQGFSFAAFALGRERMCHNIHFGAQMYRWERLDYECRLTSHGHRGHSGEEKVLEWEALGIINTRTRVGGCEEVGERTGECGRRSKNTETRGVITRHPGGRAPFTSTSPLGGRSRNRASESGSGETLPL